MISTIMPSSFKPLRNCSSKCVTISLYLHSIAITWSLPISSIIFSLSCLFSLQYYNSIIVSLCWGLNLLFKVYNKPSNVLCVSCSACVRSPMNFRYSLPRQFLVIATLPAWFVSRLKMFFTSNLKFLSSVYLSVAFQSKDGCFSVCLP